MCIAENALDRGVLARVIERVEAARLRRETGRDYRVRVTAAATEKGCPSRVGSREGRGREKMSMITAIGAQSS